MKQFIDAILEADRKGAAEAVTHREPNRGTDPEEKPQCKVSESSVRRYVRRRKQEMGLAARETLVPQSCAWGEEAQVDWCEAEAELGSDHAVAHDSCFLAGEARPRLFSRWKTSVNSVCRMIFPDLPRRSTRRVRMLIVS